MESVRIELDREADGRWTADIPSLPGVTVSGGTKEEAIARAKEIAFVLVAKSSDPAIRVLAGPLKDYVVRDVNFDVVIMLEPTKRLAGDERKQKFRSAYASIKRDYKQLFAKLAK